MLTVEFSLLLVGTTISPDTKGQEVSSQQMLTCHGEGRSSPRLSLQVHRRVLSPAEASDYVAARARKKRNRSDHVVSDEKPRTQILLFWVALAPQMLP